MNLNIVNELNKTTHTMVTHVIPIASFVISAASYLGVTLFISDSEEAVFAISGTNQNHMTKINSGRMNELIRRTLLAICIHEDKVPVLRI